MTLTRKAVPLALLVALLMLLASCTPTLSRSQMYMYQARMADVYATVYHAVAPLNLATTRSSIGSERAWVEVRSYGIVGNTDVWVWTAHIVAGGDNYTGVAFVHSTNNPLGNARWQEDYSTAMLRILDSEFELIAVGDL